MPPFGIKGVEGRVYLLESREQHKEKVSKLRVRRKDTRKIIF